MVQKYSWLVRFGRKGIPKPASRDLLAEHALIAEVLVERIKFRMF
jgi:hypothetical protein